MQLSITKIVRSGGRIYIRFSDKTEMEFNTLAELRQRLHATFDNKEFVRSFLLTLLLTNDPDLNVSPVGKKLTIDLSSSTPMVLS